MWKGSDVKKTKILTHEEIKKQFNWWLNSNIIEINEINKKVEEVQKPEDAATVIKQIWGDHSDQEERNYNHHVSSRKSVQKI